MNGMREIITKHPVIAILRKVPQERVADYVGSIVNGGVRAFEISLNTPDGLQQIAGLKERYGDQVLIGAGTVLTAAAARDALSAGAQFLLSPSADVEVLEFCAREGVCLLPGVYTPTEVSSCLRYGFETLKLFPAGNAGDGYVKNLQGPFDQAQFVAIGGVNRSNALHFLEEGCIGVGLGSNLLPKDAAAAGDWERCSQAVRELAEAVREFLEGKEKAGK